MNRIRIEFRYMIADPELGRWDTLRGWDFASVTEAKAWIKARLKQQIVGNTPGCWEYRVQLKN